MLSVAKTDMTVPPAPPAEDVTIGALLVACDQRPASPLVFFYGGRPIRPGFHVTEVKAGQFAALDCGGNPEAWPEIFVQLWDIDEGDRTHMTAGKFAAIIRKVSDYVAVDAGARLTFEVSDGVAPMQLHCASTPELMDGVLRVELSPRAASCKPRDRWLEQQRVSACCAPSTSKQPCCG
jgi:hypothetical protein